MADDDLRDMAAHRGYKLIRSRRRKPGGDFGLFGLRNAAGEPAFGMVKGELTATAAQIEAFLRDGTRATWSKSAGSAKRVKAPPPPPKPKPKPAFKPRIGNLLAKLPAAKRAEVFTELLTRPRVRLERIVSQGQATPEDTPMVQDADEWVFLIEGEARMRIEDSKEVTLKPGDYLTIDAEQKHWVTWTDPDRPTVWLALHLG